ncbi:MAG: hypothetical protein HY709_06770 [Candidatus Latescibacteria bacterium]|nr:hypothetical protein [Candidatus Latescibacterota bacterium]
MHNPKERATGFTFRAVVAGAGLSFFLNIASPYVVLVFHTAGMAADFITAGAIFLQFLFVGTINVLLRLVRREWEFSTPELITIYTMLIVASAIPTWGLVANLLPIMTGAYYYATPENNWVHLIHPYIRSWMVPNDPLAAKYFYEALPSGMPIPWGIWIRPLLAWSALIFSIYFVMICMMVILRRQWVDRERLSFPLTQLPLELVRDEGESRVKPLLKSRLMWGGFTIPFVILSMNGLHHYFHYVPTISMLTSFLFFRNSVDILLFLNFPVIGLTYFINPDVSLSLWVFHLLAETQTGVFRVIGFEIGGRNEVFCGSSPSVSHQAMGAMIVLVVYGLWTARGHLRTVFVKAFTGRKDIDDSDEAFSYRTAVFGMLIGLGIITGWLWMSGMPLWVVAMFLFGAFVIFIGLARIIAEGGVGFARAQMIPQPFVVYGVGTSFLNAEVLNSLAFTYGWAADIRTTVMASAINGFKLADAARIDKKRLVWAMMVAVVVGFAGSVWMTLTLAYTHGGINLQGWFFNGMPNTVFDFVADKLLNPVTEKILWMRWLFTGIGAVVMTFLMWVRHRYLWWPIHYLGFPIGDTWTIKWVWFSVFLGWLLKKLILKYGGITLYRQLRPCFLGMILGQIVAGGMWMGIDVVMNEPDNYLFIGVP